MGRLVVAATMTFDMITELIYNMTIHITTYDTCVYVDKSVYNSKRIDVDK